MQKIMFNDKFGLTQAVLEGRKTMTRRMIAAPYTWHGLEVYGFCINKNYLGNVKDISLVGADGGSLEDENGSLGMILPKYKIGEVVAVAQSYGAVYDELFGNVAIIKSQSKLELHAAYILMEAQKATVKGWNNKMFVRADLMPHQIRINDIKVERLQDISDEDCMKEGIRKGEFYNTFDEYYVPNFQDYLTARTPKKLFEKLIDKISGKGTWNRNPYVFVYEFELVK